MENIREELERQMERKSKVLIIIPAYNEAENLEKVVDTLISFYPQYDYIIVNDGSTDYTAEVCRRRGYQVLHLPINMGIGGAVQTGYCYALDRGYEYAVQIDGDGQHDVAFLQDMLASMEQEGADCMIGSRFVEKEGFQSSHLRRTGITFLSVLGWLLTGVRVRDITSGYRLVNRRFIEIFAKDYPADYPEPEAMVITAVHGGKIREYPVIMRERENGTSSITMKKSVYYMCKVTLAMLIRRLSFGIRRGKGQR